MPDVDWVRSYSKPGESLVFFAIKDSAPAAQVPETWYQVRKKIGDIRNTLPAGIQGPFFNDEFGDTYTNIYAITGDGFGYRELKEFGDRMRAELLRVPGVAKVDFIGEQDEKIFVEMSNAQARDARRRARADRRRRSPRRTRWRPPACSTPATDRIFVRPTGAFDSLEAIRDIAIRANDRVFRLGDIARRLRAATSTRRSRRCAGRAREALGIGVTMVKGGDVIELGHDARRARSRGIQRELPVGVEIAHGREHAARGAALGQRVRALARRGGGHRARRVAAEPRACAPASSSPCRSRWCSR